MLLRLLPLFLLLAPPAPAAEPAKPPAAAKPAAAKYDPIEDYRERKIEGFTVFINRKVFDHKDGTFEVPPLDVLNGQFKDVVRSMPADVVEALRRDVKIWVEWDRLEPENAQAVGVYRSGSESALAKKNVLPKKANGVEIISLHRVTKSKQPSIHSPVSVLLHELAHAYHHTVIGTDNEVIKAAFRQAVDRKLYDSVADLNGKKGRAYAMTNEYEYFAELSEAYLLHNDFYPFTRAELKEHDPVGHRLMTEAWTSVASARHLDKAMSLVVKADKPKPAKPSATAKSEAAASKKLEVAKLLIARNQIDRACEFLAEVASDYPGTAAAREATSLRTALQPGKK